MPRRYDPRYSDYPSRYADDPRERQDQDKTPTWQKVLKWVGIGIIAIIVLLFILSATGNLKGSGGDATINQTAEPTKMEQLTTYIISQQNEGRTKEEIVQRLTLAGFEQDDIETGFALSDPIIQQILAWEKEGKTQQQIVELLLDQGMDPLEIQTRLEIIKKSRESGGLFAEGSWLRKNWFILIPLGILLYFLWKNQQDAEEEKLMPKVYTLDECEEYAREYLEKKGKAFNPSKQYRNRPDIRQYRFIYEEPLYPGFNDHLPAGQRIGQRIYWLIAIGYDREVIDYQETTNDNLIHTFLYGPPKSFEASGSKEYMGLRAKSEAPIEERRNRTEDETSDNDYYRPYPYRRRNYPRVRPGPVRGYEEP
jgi:hypothetical protein